MIYVIKNKNGAAKLANRNDLLSYNDNPNIQCFAVANNKYEAKALYRLYSRELIQPDKFRSKHYNDDGSEIIIPALINY